MCVCATTAAHHNHANIHSNIMLLPTTSMQTYTTASCCSTNTHVTLHPSLCTPGLLENGRVIMDKHTVRSTYMQRWLPLDIISAIPLSAVAVASQLQGPVAVAVRAPNMIRLVKLPHTLTNLGRWVMDRGLVGVLMGEEYCTCLLLVTTPCVDCVMLLTMFDHIVSPPHRHHMLSILHPGGRSCFPSTPFSYALPNLHSSYCCFYTWRHVLR